MTTSPMKKKQGPNHPREMIDTRQMVFVEKLLKQPQLGAASREAHQTASPPREPVEHHIVATQVKLDPVPSTSNRNGTMSSRNSQKSEQEQTLIPLETDHQNASVNHVNVPQYSSQVGVTTILEENPDVQSLIQQSQHDEGFTNMKNQLHDMELLKTRHPLMPEASAQSYRQKIISYQHSGGDQLGAMTISKYQMKSNMKTFVAGSGQGIQAVQNKHFQKNFGVAGMSQFLKNSGDSSDFDKFLQEIRQKNESSKRRNHLKKPFKSVQSPKQLIIEDPIKISSIPNRDPATQMPRSVKNTAFLETFSATEKSNQGQFWMTKSPITINSIHREVNRTNESAQKKRNKTFTGQTFKEMASNMAAMSMDQEANIDVKGKQFGVNSTEETQAFEMKMRKGSQQHSQMTFNEYYKTTRFPKIKTVYVPKGQGPPKTPREIGAGRRPVDDKMTQRLNQSLKTGYQRWKTPVAGNQTDLTSTFISSNRSSIAKDFAQTARGGGAIMNFPRSFHQPPTDGSLSIRQSRPQRRTQQTSINFGNAGIRNEIMKITSNTQKVYEPKHLRKILPLHKGARNQDLLSQGEQLEMALDAVNAQSGDRQTEPPMTQGSRRTDGIISPVSFMASPKQVDRTQPKGIEEELVQSLQMKSAECQQQTQSIEAEAEKPSSQCASAQTADHISKEKITPEPVLADNLGTKSSPQPIRATNFYIDIEKQPQISLDYKLQAQEQIRALQKQIRQKNERVKQQIEENSQQLSIMDDNLKLKERLENMLSKVTSTHKTSLNSNSQEMSQSIEQPSFKNLNIEAVRKENFTDIGAVTRLVNTERGRPGDNNISIDDQAGQNSEKPKNEMKMKNKNKQILPSQVILQVADSDKPKKTRKSPFLTTKVKRESTQEDLQKAHEQNLTIERRISNLYKQQVQSDLISTKRVAQESIQTLKNKTHSHQEDAINLRRENQKLKNIIRKYKYYIDNFQIEQIQPKQSEIDLKMEKESDSVIDFHMITPRQLNENNMAGQSFENSQHLLSNEFKDPKMLQTMPLPEPAEQKKKESSSLHIYTSKSIDALKLARLSYNLQQFQRKNKDKPIEFIMAMLDNVKTYFNCSKAMFVPVNPIFIQVLLSNYNKARMAKHMHELDFIDQSDKESKKMIAICQSSDEVSDIVFTSLRESSKVASTTYDGNKVGMLFRLHEANGCISFMIQVEMEEQKPAIESLDPSHQSKRHLSQHTQEKRFNRSEVLAVQETVFQCCQLMFEKHIQNQKRKAICNEQQKSINMIQHMAKCTTLRGLMREMNNQLTKFFGFEDVNILFHDPEKEQLYTITFGDEEENKHRFEARIKAAATEQEKETIRDEESFQDVILSADQMIFYPTHIGLTSKAFQHHQCTVANDFPRNPHLNAQFVSAIDNPRGIKHIENFMMSYIKRDDGSSNGVIQLFNCRNQITIYEEKKLKAMARFFGGCVQNIESTTTKLTTMLAIGHSQPAEEAIQRAYGSVVDDGTLTSYLNLQKAVANLQQTLSKEANWKRDEEQY